MSKRKNIPRIANYSDAFDIDDSRFTHRFPPDIYRKLIGNRLIPNDLECAILYQIVAS